MSDIKLPPLPNPVCYYWTPKQESGLPAKLSSWSTNTGPHPDWDVGRYFNEEELRARDLEVARVVLEAAAEIADKYGNGAYLIALEIRNLKVSHE